MDWFHFFISTGLMIFLPILLIAIELLINGSSSSLWYTAGKWFVFCGVGLRLLSAGIMQVVNPAFTAENIFGMSGADTFIFIRELGFANIGIGAAGIVSLFLAGWRKPVALTAALFFTGLSIHHVLVIENQLSEWVALVTDAFIAVILLLYLILDRGRNVKNARRYYAYRA